MQQVSRLRPILKPQNRSQFFQLSCEKSPNPVRSKSGWSMGIPFMFCYNHQQESINYVIIILIPPSYSGSYSPRSHIDPETCLVSFSGNSWWASLLCLTGSLQKNGPDSLIATHEAISVYYIYIIIYNYI